jgi:hypothetical protein
MTETVTQDPKIQMTETKGNVFLSAKNNYGDIELRNLSIVGIGNPESKNLNKVTVYTAEYTEDNLKIEVPGKKNVAFLEKLVFIDKKTIVCTSRTEISPTVLKAIGRTFTQEEQLEELPHYRFIADAQKAHQPVYAYAIRMTQKPQVFALSSAEDGYMDIQVTPAETTGKAVLSAIDANGITYVMQNLNIQTKELKKLNWSLAATVQLPEGIRPLTMINVVNNDHNKVMHIFGTNNGMYRLIDDVTELVPGTEGKEIKWLEAHTATGTIFASTRNAENEVEFLGINEIFTDKFKAFTWQHSSDMIPTVTELENVQALTGPITEVDNNPGILLAWPQASEETSYTYATRTLELSAAV